MWIFVKDTAIMATAQKEQTAKRIAMKIKGKGYKVIHADEILPVEDVWDLDLRLQMSHLKRT